MFFLEHIWEGASPVLLHGMPRRLAAVHLTQRLCHPSLVDTAAGASEHRCSSSWLALPRASWRLSFSTTPLPREAKHHHQRTMTQCSSSSTYDIHHTPPPSRPAVPHAAVAAAAPQEASRHPVPPRQPCCQMAGMLLVLISHGPGALPSQLAEAIVCLTNGLRKTVNWVSSFSGFGERVAYFSVICIYLGDNPASPGLPTSPANIVSQGNFCEVVAASGTPVHTELFVLPWLLEVSSDSPVSSSEVICDAQVPFSLCPFSCDSSDSLAHKVKPLPHFISLSESFGSPSALFKD